MMPGNMLSWCKRGLRSLSCWTDSETRDSLTALRFSYVGQRGYDVRIRLFLCLFVCLPGA